MVRRNAEIAEPAFPTKQLRALAKRAPLINTIDNAIRFLEKLEISVVGTRFGWHIKGIGKENRDFGMDFEDNAGLIEYARDERNMLVKLWGDGR